MPVSTTDKILAHSKKILFAAGLLTLIALILCINLKWLPHRDVAHRYIPMAEAFAEGDLRFAFHPRIPPLQPLCGGIVAKCFGIDAYLALKIASCAWHLAGGVLIYLLFRTVHPDDRKVALLGTICYFFFPYIFHMAYSGMRDSAKCTALILLALALVKTWGEHPRWRDYLLLGIAGGLATLIRGELMAVGLLCIFCAAVAESASAGFPRRSAFALGVSLVFPTVNALLNHHFFGHAMPDSHFACLFLNAFGRPAHPVDWLLIAAAIAALLPLAAWGAERLFRRVPVGCFWGAALFLTVCMTIFTIFTGVDRNDPGTVNEFLVLVLEGLYYFVAPMALVHVGRQIVLRKFTKAEHAVLLVAAANILLCILQVQIFDRKLVFSSRYLYTATPLFLGFFLLGWEDIYHWFSPFLPRWCTVILLTASIAGFVFMYAYHAPQPLYREHNTPRYIVDQIAIREICRLVKSDKRPLPHRETALSPWEYHSRRSPKILFQPETKLSVATHFVGGSMTESEAEADYMVCERPQGCNVSIPRNAHLLGRFTWRDRVFDVWRKE